MTVNRHLVGIDWGGTEHDSLQALSGHGLGWYRDMPVDRHLVGMDWGGTETWQFTGT